MDNIYRKEDVMKKIVSEYLLFPAEVQLLHY